MSPSFRFAALVAAGLAVVVIGWMLRRPVVRSPEHVSAGGRATGQDATSRPSPSSRPMARRDTDPAGARTATEPPPESEPEDAAPTPWAKVDLEALRRELPDNIYWTMSAPTKDEDLIHWREEERDRWNVEYGKVLSGTATADEIDTYYAHRYRLSSDYVQFATYLLADYGDDLSARDVGLLKVAIELHLARLEEIPRQTADAHARSEAHDAARREWLESQKAFAPEKSD